MVSNRRLPGSRLPGSRLPRGLSLPLLACLMLPASGCADRRAPAEVAQGHEADRRLVPPDLVWTLADGSRIPVRTWMPAGPPRAVVLALHGINDSRDAWELPGPVLAGQGIAVYAPDQRGFGAAPGRGHWPGTDQLVDDAAAMVRLLAQANPGSPLYIMGESMGGAVAMCLAARPQPLPLSGLVLLAPAVWSSDRMSPLMTGSLWTAATVLPDWQLTGRELPLHVQASDNLDALYRLSYDPLTLKGTRTTELRGLVSLMTRAAAAAPHLHGPVLVAYGAHDDLVPQSAMAATWNRLPAEARRAYYPEGYHLLMRDRERQAVIRDVASWIGDPQRALPSGADVAQAAWLGGRSWQAKVPLWLPASMDGLAPDEGAGVD